LQIGYLHLSNPARLQELMNLLGVGTPNATSLQSGPGLDTGADVSATDESGGASEDDTDSGLEAILDSSSEDGAKA
jgi:hypothetical protein